jgi:hypothetical protein
MLPSETGLCLLSMMVCRRMWRMIAIEGIPKALIALDFWVLLYWIENMNTLCSDAFTIRTLYLCSTYCNTLCLSISLGTYRCTVLATANNDGSRSLFHFTQLDTFALLFDLRVNS